MQQGPNKAFSGDGGPLFGHSFGTFYKMVDEGNVHFVTFVSTGEINVRDCLVVEVSATLDDVKNDVTKIGDPPSAKLQDFLDKIGTEPVTEFFAGLQRRSTVREGERPAPKIGG